MINELYNSVYSYELILCLADKDRTQLAIITPSSFEYKPVFRDVDNLRFTVDYLSPVYNGAKVNPTFNDIKGNHLILLNIKNNDTVIKSDYFVIINPKLEGVERDQKTLDCYSLEYKLGKRLLRGYKQVAYFYDSVGSNGLVNYILNELKTYTIGTVSSSLLNQQRSFDYAEVSFMECLRELESKFNCIFEFDNYNMVLNIHSLTEYGNNNDVFVSEENFMKNLSKEEKFGEITTKYYLYGKNNLGIASKNITGQNYVLDFSYFRITDFMSQDLLDALDAYDIVLSNNQGVFEGYLSQLDSLNSSLLTKNSELSNLRVTLLQYQENMNTAIRTGSAFGYPYSHWYSLYVTQEGLITTKINEINVVQGNINTVNSNIQTLNNTVSLESNFTADQLFELSGYISETSETISEIEDVQTLYDEAIYQLSKKSNPVTEFSIDIVDFLSIPEASMMWESLVIGDYINIDYKKFGIECLPLRLVSYTHDPLNNQLQLDFSNQDYYNNDNYLYMSRIWKKSNQTSNTVTVEKPNYNLYTDEKSTILYNGQTINSASNIITLPDGSTIGDNGFIMADDLSANNQMRILGDRILFTLNRWQTVSTGIDANGIHALNIDGSTITGSIFNGGEIHIDTIIDVGDEIRIGDLETIGEKTIYFYNNSSTSDSTYIRLTTEGYLDISSYNDIFIGDLIALSNGVLTFSGTVDFQSCVVTNIGTTDDTQPNHNHGIVDGTRLAIVDSEGNITGSVVFVASGGFTHSHLVNSIIPEPEP